MYFNCPRIYVYININIYVSVFKNFHEHKIKQNRCNNSATAFSNLNNFHFKICKEQKYPPESYNMNYGTSCDDDKHAKS